MNRYGTFQAELPTRTRSGILDAITGREYETVDLKTAEQLLALINNADCKFNCRAKREEDYLQGWVDRDRECPIIKAGLRCAKRYLDGAASGLKHPLAKSQSELRE